MTLDKDEQIIGMELTNNFEGPTYYMASRIVALTNKGRVLQRKIHSDSADWIDISPERNLDETN